ncbi:helix-turn-helix domain-containing protein [Massilia dura]|uniref:Helix-turn-helix domain-containing protein n=1 Tax=Pseudoduganella dura TaxID=321982 RepID=A0A6I3XI00_9BURK|nr:AraC family transcriptional regulator [Pseudoduganella dura]MUI13271.1 helix-turn-helix domain-containing protein [Pseudoduganella dura]
MDSLSRLLSLYPLQTALNVRCHFGAPWQLQLAHAGDGCAPYHVLVSGSAILEMPDGACQPLATGDAVLFPHGNAHRIHAGEGAPALSAKSRGMHLVVETNDGPGPASDILCGELRFGPEAAPLLRTLPDVVLVRTAGQPALASLRALIALLQQEAETDRPGTAAILAQLTSALFALLLRGWIEQSGGRGLLAVLAVPRLQPALHAMLAEPGQPWSLDSLARLCHMSRATFVRAFRHAAGLPPAEVLTQLRMARAARLLAQGRLGAGQIGEQVGYQSEAAFNRVFKRHHGVGPGEYRRAARRH